MAFRSTDAKAEFEAATDVELCVFGMVCAKECHHHVLRAFLSELEHRVSAMTDFEWEESTGIWLQETLNELS